MTWKSSNPAALFVLAWRTYSAWEFRRATHPHQALRRLLAPIHHVPRLPYGLLVLQPPINFQ
jgi:hypothetical protein